MLLLDQLHAEGATLITVTHNPVYAERAGRRIHMIDGRLRDQA
jgi:putative ABC transport system ATP-binding protein